MRTNYQKIIILTIMALLAAMVTLSTYVFRIPISISQGYIHLGDGFILLSAYLLSPKKAALSSAVGSVLADVLAPALIYAVPTFFIKGIMGFTAGVIFRRQHYSLEFSKIILPALLNGLIMLAGYYIYECFLLGFRTASAVILLQLIQAFGGIVVGVILIPVCGKVIPQNTVAILRD